LRSTTDGVRSSAWVYGIVLALALAIHVFSVTQIGPPPVVRDALGYSRTTQRLLLTGTFSYSTADPSLETTPNAFITPGYVFWLAPFFALTGEDEVDSDTWLLETQPLVTVGQLCLGLLVVSLVTSMALSIAGRRAGLLAGAVAAAYIPYGANAAFLLSEQLAAALFTIALWAAVRSLRAEYRASSAWLLVATGFAVLTTLVRPVVALWCVVPLLLWTRCHWHQRAALVRPLLAAALVAVAIMAPWWARSALTLHRFVPLSDGGSAALYHAAVGAEGMTEDDERVYVDAIERGADPLAAVSRERVLSELRARPLPYLGERASQLWQRITRPPLLFADLAEDTWMSGGVPGGGVYVGGDSFLTRRSESFYQGLYDWTLILHRAILGAALLGVWVLRKRGPVVVLLASAPIYFIAVHSLTLMMTRYLYPMMSACIVLAVLFAEYLVRLRSRTRKTVAAS